MIVGAVEQATCTTFGFMSTFVPCTTRHFFSTLFHASLFLDSISGIFLGVSSFNKAEISWNMQRTRELGILYTINIVYVF